MPITEAQMSYEGMQQTVKDGHVCGQCGGRLNVAWSPKDNCHILRCKNIEHNTITRHIRKSEHEIKAEKEWRAVQKMDSQALQKMDEKQMLARVDMAKFPQEMTVADKRVLAQVAITYGFDPLMSEVMIYQGRPYVSIDGRYRMAQETGNLDGVESRPATKQERTEWQIPEGDYFYRAEVYVKGASRPFVGWGRVFAAEYSGGKGYKPVEKNPQRMAEKRGEAQALRKAFHLPLPSAEDIGTPGDDAPVVMAKVIDGDGVITDAKIPGKTTETPVTDNARDLSTIKNFGDLYTACNKDFKLNRQQVLAELGVNTQEEITDTPAFCYTRIASIRK